MRWPAVLFLTAMCGAAHAAGPTPPGGAAPPGAMADPARGALLYKTSCASCHDRETHWRGRHQVRDWATLLQQVTHWQEVAQQNWGQHEIEDVGAYLNRQFYGVPCPVPRCSAGTVGKAPPGS
jgi:mono/diheme cytochrome c family protein